MKRELKVLPHKSKEDVLQPSEIDALIFSCKTDKERLVILTLLNTGLRVGEFVHMKRDWVDWQKEQINVPIKQECGCKNCVGEKRGAFWSPKTKNGVRSIPLMDDSTKKILRTHFTFNKEIGFSKAGVWVVVKRLAKRAGLMKRIYPHSIRATAATIFGHKFSAPTVMYVMGWGDLGTAEMYVEGGKQRALDEIRGKQ